MPAREIVPTHSAYLDLKAERAAMREGYRFLDEKRLILASEILAMLKEYEAAQELWQRAQQQARADLRAALGRHGIEGLSVYPSAPARDCTLSRQTRSVLGVRIDEAAGPEPEPGSGKGAETHVPGDDAAAVNPSPEADACRNAFAALVPLAGRLALLTGNLERLRREYIRTARRARALEDVLLPEIDETLAQIDTALEELEREESVRVRSVNR